ncbi:MAG: carboxylesterase family protein [Azospirillaceae bacterium]|nr:carboxylesterase family protein [Azospirillaceae bacterium]
MTAPKTISRLLAAWVGGAALLMGQGPAVAADAPTLVVDGGRVAVPAANAEGLRVFKGIPYAAPPVGPLRWKPPEAVAAWSGVRPTESFGADCPQPTSPASPEDRPKSEDCLFVQRLGAGRPGQVQAAGLCLVPWRRLTGWIGRAAAV